MKKNLLSATMFFVILLLTSVKAIPLSPEIPKGNFTGIELRNAANVYVTQGEATDIKIEADEEVASKLILEIKNDVLVIRSEKENNSYGKKKIDIYVTVKTLKLLELAGSGNMIMKNQVKGDDMSLLLSGSGNIEGSIDVKDLKMSIAGSGNIDVKGKTNDSTVKISGSGDVNGKELKTSTSTVSISGSGTSTVDVGDELNVTITGSGNVYYLSAPEKIHSKIVGSGKIEKVKA